MRDIVEHCSAGNPMFFRGQRLERFNLSCQQRNPQPVIVVIVYQPRVVACQSRLERPRPPSRRAKCSDTHKTVYPNSSILITVNLKFKLATVAPEWRSCAGAMRGPETKTMLRLEIITKRCLNIVCLCRMANDIRANELLPRKRASVFILQIVDLYAAVMKKTQAQQVYTNKPGWAGNPMSAEAVQPINAIAAIASAVIPP